MNEHPDSLDLLLEPEDNERLRNTCGQLDEHLRQMERRLGIEISNRGNFFRLFGAPEAVRAGREVLQGLFRPVPTKCSVRRGCISSCRSRGSRPTSSRKSPEFRKQR